MKKKILILFLMLFTLSGCTKRFNVVINEEKNQQKSYVSNILCKPETKELVDVYKDNDKKLLIKYEDLPKCSNLKINSGGYEGLWTSLFVKPLAWIIVKVGLIVKNYGLAIMIVGLILRLLMFPISKKSTNMNINIHY